MHIETIFGDLVRIDLQPALQGSMDTLHLPVKRLQDDQVMMFRMESHATRTDELRLYRSRERQLLVIFEMF